jgi:hypothetical protein
MVMEGKEVTCTVVSKLFTEVCGGRFFMCVLFLFYDFIKENYHHDLSILPVVVVI